MRNGRSTLRQRSAEPLRPVARPRELEHELLLACSTSRITPARTEQIAALARQQPDWRLVRSRAWDHGVVPLIYRQLAVAPDDAVPEEVLAGLSTTATAIGATNLRLASALLELIGSLEHAGVRTIAYKGPTLAMRAYGNLALRHYNDLDVLIQRRDIAAATRALQALGYRLHDPVGRSAQEAALRWGHHFAFLRERDTLLEVHWRFHKPLFGSSLPEDEIWRRSVETTVAGRPVRTLNPVHELLVLATHGSWHGWSQLSWVCDVAEFLRASPDLDPAEVIDAARQHGYVRPLLLAFHLANRFLGVELPGDVATAVARESAVTDAGAVIERRVRAGSAPDYESARLQLALRERMRDKAAFALRAMFQPNPADLRAARLPAPLFPLYYVFRPFRMVFKYRPRPTGAG